MCGRYTLRNPTGHPWIDPKVAGGLPPRYNIAPGQQVLTLGRDREGARVTRLALWGFHPHWLPAGRRAPINARIEGAAERPLFRRACAAGRCLVPADARCAAIHQRMPVVVPSDEAASTWLEAATPGEAIDAVAAADARALAIDPVSRRVNRPENDDPACVRVQREGQGDGA